MSGENGLDIIEYESENYTYASSLTLEMEFPQKAADDVLRELPAEPLRERSPEQKAQLRGHPFFVNL